MMPCKAKKGMKSAMSKAKAGIKLFQGAASKGMKMKGKKSK